jgi:hypothetical protein
METVRAQQYVGVYERFKVKSRNLSEISIVFRQLDIIIETCFLHLLDLQHAYATVKVSPII